MPVVATNTQTPRYYLVILASARPHLRFSGRTQHLHGVTLLLDIYCAGCEIFIAFDTVKLSWLNWIR